MGIAPERRMKTAAVAAAVLLITAGAAQAQLSGTMFEHDDLYNAEILCLNREALQRSQACKTIHTAWHARTDKYFAEQAERERAAEQRDREFVERVAKDLK